MFAKAVARRSPEPRPPQIAQSLYDLYCQQLSETGLTVAKGIFGADMQVTLTNRGPVTLVIDSSDF